MPVFEPKLAILPPPQRRLWPELASTPGQFTLYGGTALALRLGHRASVDFDFFSNSAFDPDRLAAGVPYLRDTERVQVDANTLTCRLDRGGSVLVSFFGGLNLGQVAPADRAAGPEIAVASLRDIAGAKAAVIQKRAEAKDYIDLDALLRNGVDLPTALAAGRVLYGRSFNPLITLKALSYFEDVFGLPAEVKQRLAAAVAAVDPARLPSLTAYAPRRADNGHSP
jgi:Nucleotidyl transferase AbiEii toxin, Type IV TA system